MMLIFLPKQIAPLDPNYSPDSPLFFLAGPVGGGGDWQVDMAMLIHDHIPGAYIAIPTHWDLTHRLAPYFYQPFTEAANSQLDWENNYLLSAGTHPRYHGCIIFWLPLEDEENPRPGPKPYAMDTRRELGKFTGLMYCMDVRMVIGGDRRFYGLNSHLRELSDAASQTFPFYESMEEVVEHAIITAQRRG